MSSGGDSDFVSEDGGIAQGFDGEGGAGELSEELGLPVDDLRIYECHRTHDGVFGPEGILETGVSAARLMG